MKNTMETMQWHVVVTPLGSIIAKGDLLHSQSDCIPIYDACTIVQRPSSVYVPEGVFKGLYTDEETRSLTFSETQARSMGMVYDDITNGPQELCEIEGPYITDYVPIRPNQDILKTCISLCVSNIIYYYPVDNPIEIQGYVDKLMGRAATQELEFSFEMLERLGIVDESEKNRRQPGTEGAQPSQDENNS